MDRDVLEVSFSDMVEGRLLVISPKFAKKKNRRRACQNEYKRNVTVEWVDDGV